ncbi:acetate--CoA ligase [Legionella maceachernii]|uniref:Acetate--CoA ligase n=3 Tax=Legionella TaxID=445 RepID=A0A0W0W1Y5_9GAMM|nr:acetate--CoA ligase [Legionella maceachernii]KTD26242.1 acetyl-coenzyme A synthetase [Legionella maceachernii]SKA10111.1 acetyl-coenzyme A synthetase [Legionella maceachernii]SUO99499.1 Acetyl-coenzyme A synthetase [Legionella maceachernii]
MNKERLPQDINPQAIEQFWAKTAAQYVHWIKPWKTVLQGSLATADVRWFSEGKLNVSANCLDKHLPHKANHPAILWEGDEENQQVKLTFAELYQEVCRIANGLKSLGIHKGDRVGIYLPMIPEAAIAMLACARIGAVHTVVFAGFSAKALRQRLEAADCKLLITAEGYQRGGKFFSLKPQADEASKNLNIQTLVVKNSDTFTPFEPNSNHWWHELKERASTDCPPEPMEAEDPLFILYTSGSTGQPKGVVHTTGGYLVQVAYSHDYIFRCTGNEVFWCTADIGWITGHSYVVYGPLCNGITTLMFAGIPTWPNPSRCWKIIDKNEVSVFYTAPTAIRALKREGDDWLATTSRKSLRLLGTVGEPINPEVWQWYHDQVGLNQSPIVDTWWQTETGAIMICPQEPLESAKPGAASKPLPGIYPVLLDEHGNEIQGAGEGALAIKYPWPSMARTIAGDHQRYRATYLINGYYITGDGARRDQEGDYWITGRIDDVINVSGHRLGTAEIESALILHPQVAEAAVVGIPHSLKGQGIHAFVSLKADSNPNPRLEEELLDIVKTTIGSIAKPDVIQRVTDLPKTRSGKIMRRVLRKIAENEEIQLSELGDLSTLANPQAVDKLIAANKMTPSKLED